MYLDIKISYQIGQLEFTVPATEIDNEFLFSQILSNHKHIDKDSPNTVL